MNIEYKYRMDWLFDFEKKIYVKIDSTWFDFTDFKNHPGGNDILKEYHCKNATEVFNGVKGHFDGYVDSTMDTYVVKNLFLIVYLNLIKK